MTKLKGLDIPKNIIYIIFALLVAILALSLFFMQPNFLYNLGSIFLSLTKNAVSSVSFT